MKKITAFLAIVLALLMLISCHKELDYESQSFFAMDSFAEIRLYSETSDPTSVLARCKALIGDIEKAISAQHKGGDTYTLNTSFSGISEASPHLSALLAVAEEMASLTEGSFDVKTGALLSLWQKCQTEQRLPTENEINTAVALTQECISVEEYRISKSAPYLELDFGAIGKGYAADQVVELLREAGVTCGMISFVSTVTVFGEREQGAFRIAVRCPDTSGNIAGYITIQNESLSVSGDYERFYEINGQRYDHILDPKTGYPAVNGIHSAVVIADQGAVADSLSTAIMVMGIEKTAALYLDGKLDFEAALILDDVILVTDGLVDRFTLADDGYRVLTLSQYVQ